MLEIVTLVLGPVQTNTYLVADSMTGEAAVVDPAWDGELILAEAQRRDWRIGYIWFTHAHFDHIGGAAAVADGLRIPPVVALHPDDYDLWRMQGGAALFGMMMNSGPEPNLNLSHGQKLCLGNYTIEVRHCPGHTCGHVIFVCHTEALAFVGDVIFHQGIGRTDFPGGDYDTLINSIHTQVLTLPDETRLLPGHAETTTVEGERISNPFLLNDDL